MARKRKSRNNSKIGHGAISRIGRPHNPFEPRRNRYAQKYLTLVLMGGAVFLIVKGWSESGDVDNDGDGTFYSTVQDCIDDGNNADICARGWNNAKAAFVGQVKLGRLSEVPLPGVVLALFQLPDLLQGVLPQLHGLKAAGRKGLFQVLPEVPQLHLFRQETSALFLQP